MNQNRSIANLLFQITRHIEPLNGKRVCKLNLNYLNELKSVCVSQLVEIV